MMLLTDLKGKKGFFVPIAEMKLLLEMIVVRDDEYESLAKTLESQIAVAIPATEMTPKSAEPAVKAKPGPKQRKAPKAKRVDQAVNSTKHRRKRRIKRAIVAPKLAAKAA